LADVRSKNEWAGVERSLGQAFAKRVGHALDVGKRALLWRCEELGSA
jgi:hypothetical protein